MALKDYTNKDISKLPVDGVDYTTYLNWSWETRVLHSIRYTLDEYGIGLLSYLAFPRPIGSIICGLIAIHAFRSTVKEILNVLKTSPDKKES